MHPFIIPVNRVNDCGMQHGNTSSMQFATERRRSSSILFIISEVISRPGAVSFLLRCHAPIPRLQNDLSARREATLITPDTTEVQ